MQVRNTPPHLVEVEELYMQVRNTPPHLVEVEELYMARHKKKGRAGGAHAYTILDGLQPSPHMWSADIITNVANSGHLVEVEELYMDVRNTHHLVEVEELYMDVRNTPTHLVEVEELYMAGHKKKGRAGGAHAYTILDGLRPSLHMNVLFAKILGTGFRGRDLLPD